MALAKDELLGCPDVFLKAKGAIVSRLAGNGDEDVDVAVGAGQLLGELADMAGRTNAFAVHGGVLWDDVGSR
jgi:hypothetical protein